MKKSLFILVIITIITYINILPNKLFFDDEELIYKNAYVADLKYFPKYFTTNMIAGAGKVSNMYRPLLITSFAIDHFFWRNNPIGYHFTSIILHAVNVALIFIFISKLFKNNFIAFLTSVLFAVHPVNSEAVIYASGRTDPLMTFFSLISIYFFIYFLDSVRTRGVNFFLTLVFFILALLSKETAVILPAILLVIYFIKMSYSKLNLIKAAITIWPFLATLSIYIYLRLTVLNFGNTLNFYTTANLYSNNLLVRLFTFCKVFFEYLMLFIFPKDLIISRSPEIISSPLNIWVIIFISFIILCVFYIVRQKEKGEILPFFALSFFLITILPSSGIIPINNIESEHYLYFPGIAFFLIAAFFFHRFINLCHSHEGMNPLFRKHGSPSIILRVNKSGITSLGIVILILLFARTVLRTFDWRDPITFYNISLAQSPINIPMRNNLAMAYAENGQIDKAINQYQLIIKTNDSYPHVHHNLGNAYKDLKKYQEAEKEYLKALEIDPKFYFSLFALAELYQKTNQTEKYYQIFNTINNLPKL